MFRDRSSAKQRSGSARNILIDCRAYWGGEERGSRGEGEDRREKTGEEVPTEVDR